MNNKIDPIDNEMMNQLYRERRMGRKYTEKEMQEAEREIRKRMRIGFLEDEVENPNNNNPPHYMEYQQRGEKD